jgi:cytochrome c oxidase subunit 2
MYEKLSVLAITLATLALLGAGCSKNIFTGSRNNEPSNPAVTVENQSLTEDSQVIIKEASIDQNGWVAIHNQANGQIGEIIGYTALPTGTDKKIKITVDKNKVTPTLVAMLHYDRDPKGAFESPGTDGPVIRDQQVIMQEFTLANQSEVKKDAPAQEPTSARKEFIITAKQWSFSPSVIKVKKGDKVVLKLTSADVSHGFSLPDFGIDEKINKNETKTVEFTADKAGTFTFTCDVPCGAGHKAMTGTVVVE